MSENTKSYIKKNQPLIREYQIGEAAFVVKSGLTGDIDITNILHILKYYLIAKVTFATAVTFFSIEDKSL